MNLIPRWLHQLTRRPEPGRDRGDTGDMGTAFGLDASFRDEPETAPPPRASAARRVSPLTGLPRD